MASDPPRYLYFGDFRLDVDRARLWRGGEPLLVTPRTIDTLIALVRHRDRVVAKQELLDLVWPDANVEEANLAQQVFTLRRLLGDDTEQPRFIATVPRRGYRFIADVAHVPDGIHAPSAGSINGGGTMPPLDDGQSGKATVPVAGTEAGVYSPGAVIRLPDRRPALRTFGWLAVAACAGLAAGLVLRSQNAPSTAPLRPVSFEVALPGTVRLLPALGLAGLSPDGRVVAFVASDAGGAPLIFVRALASTSVRPLPGTDHAAAPFWSHDGTRLGFFAGGKLRTVPRGGGVVVDVCDAEDQRGGTWGADGSIVFAAGSRSVLYKVPARGGTPVPITRLDQARRDISHRYPSFVPGGRRFLFEVWSGDTSQQGIFAGEIGSDRVWRVSQASSPAGFTGSQMVFVHREALVAQSLDVGSLAPAGEISTVASPVARGPDDRVAFSATRSGITYVPSRFEARLVWRDRAGREISEAGGAGQYESPAISPDGRHILFSHRDRGRGVENFDVWMADLSGGNRTRLTFDGAVDIEPVWSPDGREIVFRSNRSGFSDLYRRQVDTTVPESLLYASKSRKDVNDWSPDGRSVLFTTETVSAGTDLWTLPVDTPDRAVALVSGPGWQSHGRFSPDGLLVAYQSSENDEVEVFVQVLGPSGRRLRVGRGEQPMWRGDGRELFFVEGSAMTAVTVAGRGGSTSLGPRSRLFDVQLSPVVRNAYAITPDGTRFLTVERMARDPAPALLVLLDPPF